MSKIFTAQGVTCNAFYTVCYRNSISMIHISQNLILFNFALDIQITVDDNYNKDIYYIQVNQDENSKEIFKNDEKMIQKYRTEKYKHTLKQKKIRRWSLTSAHVYK